MGNYITPGGVVVLTIPEALPRSKVGMMPEVHERWLNHIHHAIGELHQGYNVPKFHKALVGIHISTVQGVRSRLSWDTTNRAVNLVINNLKGIFFLDDDIEHMAFALLGQQGHVAKTVIYIGDFDRSHMEVCRLFYGPER